jgi:Tol biopolymer transport system component
MTRTVDLYRIFARTRKRAVALAVALAVGGAGMAEAGPVELISKANPIPDSFYDSRYPSFSADGRYVLFGSDAPNLLPGQEDENSFSDLFLHDRVAGTTTLVSHQAGSPETVDGASDFDAGISADGRYVAYSSPGTQLAAGVTDTNNVNDVFLWDRVTDTTTLVSHAAGAASVAADDLSYRVRISADGNWVVFVSQARNLVAGQTDPPATPPSDDVFLWSRASGTVTLLSRKSGAPATTGSGLSWGPEISADGSFVVFRSEATDLVPGLSDANGTNDVFVYQRSSGAVSLVSRASGNPLQTAGGSSLNPLLSADGRFIAFTSSAGNLMPGQMDDSSGLPDAFLFDRATGEIRLASHTSASPVTAAGITDYLGLALSADGRALAFVSLAANLVPGQVDTSGGNDVFVYDRLSGSIELASRTAASPTTATADTVEAVSPSLSADGRFVTFQSAAMDLVPGQTDIPRTDDVFLYDRSDKTTTLVSHRSASLNAGGDGSSGSAVVSPDGSAVAFGGSATNLDPEHFDPNGFSDLFVYSRGSAEVTLLSHRDPSLPIVTPWGPSSLGEISADGRTILFRSRASGVIPGQIDEPFGYTSFGSFFRGDWDAFLHDRTTGKTILLSRSDSSPLESAGLLGLPVLSADGRFAAFVTLDPALPPGTGFLLKLYDRVTDAAVLVNHLPGAPAEVSEGFPGKLAVSANGLAYECTRCTLVPGQQDGTSGDIPRVDVFLYDRVTGANTLVSHAHGSPATGGDNASSEPAISADGRFLAFASRATNLVAGQSDVPGTYDVFVFDRRTGATVLTSRAGSAARAGNGESTSPVISADGRAVAFRSAATDLVTGQADTNEKSDLFLFDRVSGALALASHAASSPTLAGNGESAPLPALDRTISLSADGRYTVYESAATDLVAGQADANGEVDVFLYDRVTRTNTLVSHAHGAPAATGNKGAAKPQISADGRRIAFTSAATNLAPEPTATGLSQVVLQDRITGARTTVGPAFSFPSNDLISLSPRLSASGRFTAFTSLASDFVAGDRNGNWDVFLYDAGPDGPVAVPPCTLFDTRRPVNGPALRSGTRKILTARGSCGVPAAATAVVVNVTVPQPRRRGSLALFPGNVTAPASAILRFQKGQTRAAIFTVPLAPNGTLALQPTVIGNGTVQVAVEVVGYAE